MNRLLLIISEFTEAAGWFSGIATQTLDDRMELLASDVREARIRLIRH